MNMLSLEEKSAVCNHIEVRKLNYIQSAGVLLVVSKKGFEILQVSENIEEWFGIEAKQLLNQRLDQIPINHFIRDILSFLALQEQSQNQFWTKVNHEANYEVIVQEQELFFVLEYLFKDEKASRTDFSVFFDEIITLSYKRATISFSEICQSFAEIIKKALGFDKILIYQFLEDQSGEVIAEAKEQEMESYLGFHFPKYDVPDPVRALYLKNPLRYIFDSQQAPVSIIPAINPLTNQALDLSLCILKGVAPVHREYTNNMHIRTSVSYAIRVHDKLWGLVSCHHRQKKFLNYKDRQALGYFAYLISNECLLKQEMEQFLFTKEQLNILSEMGDVLPNIDKSLHELFLQKSKPILSLVNATGAAFYSEGQLTVAGMTPTRGEIERLIQWLYNNHKENIFYTESLSKLFSEAEKYKKIASGMIAASLRSGALDYILWFRPEQLTVLNWGGNPNELTITDKLDEVKPRQSFHLWREEVFGYSQKWLPNEIEAVEQLVKEIDQAFLNVYYSKRMNAESEALKFQIAVDKASEGILILDQSGKVEWMNSRLIDIFGKHHLNEVLLPFVSLLKQTFADHHSVIESIEKAIISKTKTSIDITLHDQSFLLVLSPFKNLETGETKLVGIVTDITEIKSISREIETKIQALHMANERLDKLNKEKDQFIRMAAHDLRNPLSTISMAASILDTESINEQGFKRMLGIIINQSKSMLELLNDILNVNVLQSGQFTINKQPVNIKEFIEEICEFNQIVASEKHIRIQIEEKIEQAICNIDKIKIKQVIDNFLSNAIKFSPPKSVIKVTCLTTSTHFRVEVQDEGPGILPEDQEKIFNQHAHIISKSKGQEAHGLGLPICKQIIRAHQGDIGVEKPGTKGSTFYFDIEI